MVIQQKAEEAMTGFPVPSYVENCLHSFSTTSWIMGSNLVMAALEKKRFIAPRRTRCWWCDTVLNTLCHHDWLEIHAGWDPRRSIKYHLGYAEGVSNSRRPKALHLTYPYCWLLWRHLSRTLPPPAYSSSMKPGSLTWSSFGPMRTIGPKCGHV